MTPLFWIFLVSLIVESLSASLMPGILQCHDLMEGEGVMFVVLDSGYKNGLLTQLWYMLQTGLSC